ncbi:MAG: PTS mannose transporter subunit IIA [Sporolactobacillus sp.]|nr:PTS mannose transporter subunit IIA [Sporolactobacillus sp.]
MPDETWVIILTHGSAGEELLKSAEMIMGKLKNAASFSLLPGMSPETFSSMVEQKLRTLSGHVLVLADLFGGTPFNVAVALSQKYDLYIVSGLNIAMLMEADILRKKITGKKLADAVKQVGIDACRIPKFLKKEGDENHG